MNFLSIKLPRRNNGFTLIEALVYVLLIGLLFSLSIQAILTMFQAFSGMQLSRDLAQSGGVTSDRIVREIRTATSIDFGTSSFGTNPGVLLLNTRDSLGVTTTVEFFVSGGALHVREGGVDKGPLTVSHVTVDRLVFSNITDSGVPAVRFEIELTSNRGTRSETRLFTGASVLRNMYE